MPPKGLALTLRLQALDRRKRRRYTGLWSSKRPPGMTCRKLQKDIHSSDKALLSPLTPGAGSQKMGKIHWSSKRPPGMTCRKLPEDIHSSDKVSLSPSTPGAGSQKMGKIHWSSKCPPGMTCRKSPEDIHSSDQSNWE